MADATSKQSPQETTESSGETTERRRGSIFDRFRKEHRDTNKGALTSETASVQDDASVFSNSSRLPLLGRKGSSDEKAKPKKEKRESISDRGAFRIEYTPSGVPIAIENKDWPPGVSYKTSSQVKQMKGELGSFYEGGGSIVPGGENLANVGPDPDWIPGLSEEERAKLRKDKSGKYVF